MSVTMLHPQMLTGHRPTVVHHVGMPFPPDLRERVGQTIQAPWSGTGLVSATFPDGTIGEATGFVIGDRSVVTAAHALYNKEWGGKASQVSFEPARDATKIPFGTTSAASWHVPAEYPAGGRLYDYGLLVLAEPLVAQVFRYQLFAADDKLLNEGTFQIAGYPDDRAPENSMWYASGALLSPAGARMLRYRISTSGGQGGAAVATHLNVRAVAAVGIHAGVTKDRDANEAVRVTREVIIQVDAWQRGLTG